STNNLIIIVTTNIINNIPHVFGKRSNPIDSNTLFIKGSIPVNSHNLVNCSFKVVSFNNESCGFPIILKLIEYNAIIINILDNKGFIFPFVSNNPLIHPANNPASAPSIVARTGGTPFIIVIVVTAAPVTQLPSTVKSGKSNTLNDK